ncbi:MAG: hypothetical protein ACOVS5_17655 [Oligoflexus sp.]
MTWKAIPSLLFLVLAGFSQAPTVEAAVNIGLSGSAENSNNSFEKYRNHAVSANISLGLGEHLLIGVTHRRSFDNKIGLKKTEVAGQPNTFAYIPFEDNAESVTNSLDLTIIPYNGLVSPFVFGGLARRDYVNKLEILGNTIRSKQTLFPIPNYGVGIVIQLGLGFQLRITQTYSPGVKTILEEGQEKSQLVLDTYSQVWIGYKL